MKKVQVFATTALALVLSEAAHAHNTMPSVDNDTTVINNAKKVVVVTGDSIQRIEVIGKEGNDSYYYDNTVQLRDSNYVSEVKINPDWDVSIRIGKRKDKDGRKEGEKPRHMVVGPHLGIGWSAPTSVDKDISFKTFQSWEGFLTLAQYEYHPRLKSKNYKYWFSAGFEYGARIYNMKNGKRFCKNDNSTDVALGTFPDGATHRSSGINIFSLNLPLLWHLDIGKKQRWGIAAGAVVNFNVYSELYTRYKLNGSKYSEHISSAHARPVTVEFMGIVKNPFIDLYVKYSPFNVLRDNRGPKFHALSFGFYL